MKYFKLVLFLVFIILNIAGCGMRYYLLQDNITKVPSDSSVYKNKSKFDNSLLNIIDTTVIYEEYNYHNGNPDYIASDPEDGASCMYRFYSNGCFNFFVILDTEVLDSNSFNPNYSGYRGVYYKENNQIKYDLFAETKYRETLYFNGDTMYVYRDFKKDFEIYVKRKLPAAYLNYNANW